MPSKALVFDVRYGECRQKQSYLMLGTENAVKSYGTAQVGVHWRFNERPCDLVIWPLNFSEGHYYGNGGLDERSSITFDTDLRKPSIYRIGATLLDRAIQ